MDINRVVRGRHLGLTRAADGRFHAAYSGRRPLYAFGAATGALGALLCALFLYAAGRHVAGRGWSASFLANLGLVPLAASFGTCAWLAVGFTRELFRSVELTVVRDGGVVAARGLTFARRVAFDVVRVTGDCRRWRGGTGLLWVAKLYGRSADGPLVFTLYQGADERRWRQALEPLGEVTRVEFVADEFLRSIGRAPTRGD